VKKEIARLKHKNNVAQGFSPALFAVILLLTSSCASNRLQWPTYAEQEDYTYNDFKKVPNEQIPKTFPNYDKLINDYRAQRADAKVLIVAQGKRPNSDFIPDYGLLKNGLQEAKYFKTVDLQLSGDMPFYMFQKKIIEAKKQGYQYLLVISYYDSVANMKNLPHRFLKASTLNLYGFVPVFAWPIGAFENEYAISFEATLVDLSVSSFLFTTDGHSMNQRIHRGDLTREKSVKVYC
jgi:hypothetical protein